MSGTVEGGRKAVAMVKAIHGSDFYKKIGAMGGAASKTGGFTNNRKLASRAGSIGGQRSVIVRRAKREAKRLQQIADEWSQDN